MFYGDIIVKNYLEEQRPKKESYNAIVMNTGISKLVLGIILKDMVKSGMIEETVINNEHFYSVI